MIDILGLRKIVTLAALILVNVVLLYICYMFLDGQIGQKEMRLRSVNSQLNMVRADLDLILQEWGQLEEQENTYALLQKQGFTDPQNRRDAQQIFQEILTESNVISGVATIGAGKTYDDANAQKAGYKILTSPLRVEIRAVDDVDIYKYILLLKKKFRGFVDIKSIEIKRKQDVSRETLGSIIKGNNPEMVYAKIAADWKTMIPEAAVLDIQNGQKDFDE